MKGEEITLDNLRRFGLTIAQPRQGYRFSLDPLLLADFSSSRSAVETIFDLGTGSGVMAMILCRVFPAATACGIESNPAMASLATDNISRNGMAERVRIITGDVINHKNYAPVSSFDLVVSNPPFRSATSGRVSPKSGRDSARHESTAGVTDFLAAAKYLVKPSGRICFVYHPSRLPEFIQGAFLHNLALLRLRIVHSTVNAPASIFLAELAKSRKGATNTLPPLIVYNCNGEYTAEARLILGERTDVIGNILCRPKAGTCGNLQP